jgi:hypothetical protein
LVEDYLVRKWASRNTFKDRNGKLGMSGKGVPTPKEASSWSLPDSLMFGHANTKVKVKFDIGHRVEVMCGDYF